MENRIKKVRAILKTEKLDAILVSSNINIRYLTGFDGFGDHEREGYVLLTKSSLYIFASPLSAEGAREKTRNTGIEVVELTAQKRLLPTLQEIILREKISAIGFEENLTYAEYKNFKKLKNVKLKLAEEIVEEIRIVKGTEELESLKKACVLTDRTYSHVLENIRMNVTEKELAWIIEKFIKENGGELAFPSIVAFGKNSAIPHHVTSSQKLEKNSIILLDFGAKINGYHADMSRTIFFGHADEKFKKMYEAVLQAQQLPFLKSYIISPKSEDIDKLSRNHVISQGFPSIPHSVGHGVGLQVHELPHISLGFKETIAPNTAFTIEPGIYENNFGGVRIENTVYFNGKEIVSLTKSSKELIEIS